MNAEAMRAFLLGLPYVIEAQQWGGLIYWVGDKAIGGKMFAMLNPEGSSEPVTFPAPPEHFAELVERDGILPARYLARHCWVTAERWDVFRTAAEWQQEISAAHALTYDKLPARAKAVLAMSPGERRKVVAERRKLLAARIVAAQGRKKRRRVPA